MQECAYPKQFNTKTMKCEEFEKVDCGKRKNTKDGCKCMYYTCLCKDIRCIVVTCKYFYMHFLHDKIYDKLLLIKSFVTLRKMYISLALLHVLHVDTLFDRKNDMMAVQYKSNTLQKHFESTVSSVGRVSDY